MAHSTEFDDPLLGPEDPDPILIHGDGRNSPFLLVCDHAGNAIPRALGTLGLSDRERSEHIAWDPNAWTLTRELADVLNALAIGQAYSRLVIDCNRHVAALDSVAEVSDTIAIPGNASCSDGHRARRFNDIMKPYQQQIAEQLKSKIANGPCCIVSMHSFTPRLSGGEPRPWHIGVISGPDDRMRRLVFDRLRETAQHLVIGENVPYTVSLENDYTLPVHAERQGIPYVEFEFRNDLFHDEASRKSVTRLVADALRHGVAENGASR